jgi:TetR/AcrR family transcriptional regulator, transcriptional repressor for nem operon
MPSKDANDKLIAFANLYLDNFSEISKFGGCPLLNATVDSDFAHPILKKRVAKAIETWIDSISQIIYSGIKREQINRNIKPEQFASVFASLIEGGLLLSKATGSTIQLSRNIDHIIHLVNTELRV